MPVLVLGMHCSGMSALARCLGCMGLSVGKEQELVSSTRDNPLGFWENSSLARINEDILRALEGDWMAPPRFRETWWRQDHLAEIRSRARALLREWCEGSRWCWSDPRMCLTLPFWRDLISDQLTVLFVRRNPLDTCELLERRNGMSKRVALALWMRYTSSALTNAASLPVFVLDFDELVDEAGSSLARIHSFLERCGVTGLKAPVAEEIEPFLAAEQRPWRRPGEGFLEDEGVSEDQRRLYRLLLELPAESERFKPPELPEGAFLVESFEAARMNRARVSNGRPSTGQRRAEQRHTDRANMATDEEASYELRATRLGVLDKECAAWCELAEDRAVYLQEWEQAKRWALQERDALVETLLSREAALAELQQAMSRIEATLGWKVLRLIREQILPIHTMRGWLARSILHALASAGRRFRDRSR